MKLKHTNKTIYLLSILLLLSVSVPAMAKSKNYRNRSSHPFLSLAASLLNPGYVTSPYQYGYGVYQSPYISGYYSNPNNYYYGSSSYQAQNPLLSLVTGIASSYNTGTLPQYSYGTNYVSPQFVFPQTSVMGYILPTPQINPYSSYINPNY